MDWEKIFDVTNKGLIFFFKYMQLNNKKTNPIKKGAADHSLHCCC